VTYIPIYKRKIKYLNKKDAERLNLPLKTNDIRDDGYVFQYYYTRGDAIYEMWHSPQTMKNTSIRKSKDKREHSKKTRNFIKRVKLYLGCNICGYKKCSDALHFDHIDVNNKFREISKMGVYSFKSIKEEMRKCRVLCANCHAEHTQVQREEGLFNNEINN
jgi:hypothetical protein